MVAAAVVQGPWKPEEDELLRKAVDRYGERDCWKAVALEVPGRTNKMCRKRWLHSLSPDIKKTVWTEEEDRRLEELVEHHGFKWSVIAREIPGRTDDACSKRWNEQLDPTLKKGEWASAEDAALEEAVRRFGRAWKDVGEHLHRGSLACRNRWNQLERARKKAPRPHTSDDSQQSHSDPPQDYYYFPPEAYPASFLSTSSSQPSFSEPGLAVVTQQPKPVPPFQFSSSSLSAALTDPPRIPRSLPVDLPLLSQVGEDGPLGLSEELPNLFSPPSQADDYNFMDVDVTGFSPFGQFLFDEDIFMDPSPPPPLTIPEIAVVPPPQETSPGTHIFSAPAPPEHSMYNDLSSAQSSPFNTHSPLSLSSTPSATSPVDLPSPGPFHSSLLFSTYEPPQLRKPKARANQGKPTPVRLPSATTKLSSVIPVTNDTSIRPYACGHETCWPLGAIGSLSCFMTSKELCEHVRSSHGDDEDTPFRCGLAGCNKSWKSLNGLQYHLQRSTVHFRDALKTRFRNSAQSSFINDDSDLSSAPESGASSQERQGGKKPPLQCPMPECFLVYQTRSGLKYHLKHGHPKKLPAQLTVVPPMLERDITKRTKKMRVKRVPETEEMQTGSQVY